MNLEARTVQQFSESFARKCVMLRLADIAKAATAFDDLLSQTVAGGILILLPAEKPGTSLTADEEEALLQIETTMLSTTVQIPVYFAVETSEVAEIYEEIDNTRWVNNDANASATQNLLASVLANGYQMVVAGNQASAIKDPVMTNIEVGS